MDGLHVHCADIFLSAHLVIVKSYTFSNFIKYIIMLYMNMIVVPPCVKKEVYYMEVNKAPDPLNITTLYNHYAPYVLIPNYV
jgi:hypothetical protein